MMGWWWWWGGLALLCERRAGLCVVVEGAGGIGGENFRIGWESGRLEVVSALTAVDVSRLANFR